MANGSIMKGIVNSWSLSEFAKIKGKMKIASFINKDTGETFKSCAFVSPDNNITLVAFSSNLGELSPNEIKEQKAELQVVELESGTFKLCKQGATSWVDVDLGL